jgi:hypothetical protein
MEKMTHKDNIILNLRRVLKDSSPNISICVTSPKLFHIDVKGVKYSFCKTGDSIPNDNGGYATCIQVWTQKGKRIFALDLSRIDGKDRPIKGCELETVHMSKADIIKIMEDNFDNVSIGCQY